MMICLSNGGATMNELKQRIIARIDSLTDSEIGELLEFARGLKNENT